METAILFIVFIGFFLINVPVAVSLALAAILALSLDGNFGMYMIVQRMFSSLLSPSLMSIPAFVAAGVLMTYGGVSKYLINALRAWFGHLAGGLAVVTILSCAIFAAISGSSPATAAAIGAIMLPALIEGGYDKKFSMGLIAAGGTLGILIPPSVPMVVYGVTAEESVGKLFMAGLLPGLLLTAMLIVFAIVYAKVKGYGKCQKATWEERWRATFKALPGAFLPVFILGTIYLGIVTPTEAAVLSIFYTVFVSVFIYHELKFKDTRAIFRESINISSMIFLIIAAAQVFALFLTANQVPNAILKLMAEYNLGRWGFFLATNVMFLIMGTFLEGIAIILITLPLLLPVMAALHIDLIHFAVVMTVNIEIAMITPPVGLNLFVVSAMSRERVEQVVKGVLPFLTILLLALFITVIWPELSLYIPRVLMG
ncbi:MAG: TRAP transporter large permease [Deltaproteobacteria bacterium]|nr:TRAP transporter large permease [Deltaproteobacteria bacterium]